MKIICKQTIILKQIKSYMLSENRDTLMLYLLLSLHVTIWPGHGSPSKPPIILIQEHHMFYRRQFGEIPGYTLIFSPARRTMYSARGWETSGGVAILHKTNMFNSIKHKGIKQKGFDWAALHVQLEKD